jgi:hypothetical protein
MRLLILVALLAANSVSALAETPKPTCIDPQRSYVARPLNKHDVFVQTSMGAPKPPVRILTTCTSLTSAIGFGLNAQFNCVGMGDTVTATTADGQVSVCKVKRVVPYSPEEGDFKKAGP